MGIRVLMVEDESLVAEALRLQLEGRGAIVVGVADTAEAAFELAAATRPDLALMDIRIKGVRDGIDAGSALQRDLGIPVVYLTAHADRKTVERALASSPSGYLLKPYREDELFLTLEVIVQRSRGEAQLREVNLTYASVVESLAEAAIVVDEADRVLLMNPTAERLTGYPVEHASPRRGQEILVFEDAGAAGDHPLHRARHGEVVVLGGRANLVTARGERVPVRGVATPVRDVTGVVRGALVTLHDATAEREHEEEAALNQKLQALGRLAGGLAHDFNNLLMIVENGCDLILSEPDTAPGSAIAAHAQAILAATERASELTQQLLLFSRRSPVSPRPLELGVLVGEIFALVRRLIPESVALRLERLEDEVWVVADPSQVERAVMNLCLNARDAMPAGGRIDIEVGRRRPLAKTTDTHRRPAAGEPACISVRDTGVGIDPGIRDRIFEPFFTTKAVGKGTGLGLATTYGVVQQSGGAIELESELGQGSVFRLYFPTTELRPTRPERLDERPARPGSAGRVLLVEDEPALRRVLRMALETAGLEVVEAGDGVVALAVWERTPEAFSLVITDMLMPGMGGRELATEVRRQRPSQRILAMTGYDESSEDVSTPVDAVIEKPFRSAELVAVVAGLVDATARASLPGPEP